MSCHKCHKEMKLGDKVKIMCTDCYEQISDLEAKLAESERLVFTYQNIFRQKPETATEMYEFIQPYERELRKNELEIDQLKQQLAEKDKAIENWQTMYESVVQTCHNDKEEIERLNKRLETKENTITNLVEDNRASQEWYKKQLEEKDDEISFWKKHHRSIKKSSNKIFRQAGIAHNQDKISFALEQLEWIKEKVNNAKIHKIDMINTHELYEILDNQIKQLTHQHEDKGE